MPLVRRDKTAPATPARKDAAATRNILFDGSEDERWTAARALPDLADGARLLAAALERETSLRVREAMFTGLVRIATAESVELLLPLLRSDDAGLRTGTLDALRAMKSVVWPYIAQLMNDGDVDVRVLACELVRDLPAAEGTKVLCSLLDAESEPNACAAAVEVLAEIGGTEALPCLERCGIRWRGNAFLEFAIGATMERIRSSLPEQRD